MRRTNAIAINSIVDNPDNICALSHALDEINLKSKITPLPPLGETPLSQWRQNPKLIDAPTGKQSWVS
jgi:hypothetical protein